MKELDTIIGKYLRNIYLYNWAEEGIGGRTEKILFDFGKHNLRITVDEDKDEIIVSLHKGSHTVENNSSYDVIDIRNHPNSRLHKIIGQEPVWFWTMTNQQGYSDGFQMGFKNGAFQFIAVASTIDIFEVK